MTEYSSKLKFTEVALMLKGSIRTRNEALRENERLRAAAPPTHMQVDEARAQARTADEARVRAEAERDKAPGRTSRRSAARLMELQPRTVPAPRPGGPDRYQPEQDRSCSRNTRAAVDEVAPRRRYGVLTIVASG